MEASLPPPPNDVPTDPTVLESHINSVTCAIQGALNSSSVPLHLQRRSALPQHIVVAIRRRRRLRRRWQLTRSPSHRHEFIAAADRCSALLKEHRGERWEDYLIHLEDNGLSPWKATRALTREHPHNAPIQTPNGLVFDEQSKVDALASHFEGHFTVPAHPAIETLPNDLSDDTINLVVNQNLNSILPMTLEPFTQVEVSNVIKDIHPDKAPGPDGITGRAIINSPPSLLAHILVIFNAILLTQHFPSLWKVSDIIVLRKGLKSATSPSSYRPISLLPVLSKLFEKLLLQRIREVVDTHIRPEQFGFRSGCSTTLQLMKVVSDISDAYNCSMHVTAVLIDFQAAFDTVWHAGLLYKLSALFPPPVVKLFHSYLTGRKFKIVSRSSSNTSSALKSISAGVPQGSVLGPILYSIFINDMPLCRGVSLGLYADDTIFYTFSSGRILPIVLQNQINTFYRWTAIWKMKVNPDKCQAIQFSRKRIMPPQLQIGDNFLPWRPYVTYLGLILDRRLTFRQHIDKKIQLGNVLFRKLYSVLTTKLLPVKTRTLIFTAILRAHLTYAAPVWFPLLSETGKRRITGHHNRLLRTVGNFHYLVSNSAAFSYLNTPTLFEFIQNTARKLHDSSLVSHRQLVREIYELPRPPPIDKAVPTVF
jgi:hypothetical protein